MTVIGNLYLQKENNQVITRQTAGMAILMTVWGLCVLITSVRDNQVSYTT